MLNRPFFKRFHLAHTVYVISLKESHQRDFIWLLRAAAYVLVNSNAKLHVKSDGSITSEFIQSSQILQLFFHFNAEGCVDILVIKIFDNRLATGRNNAKKEFVTNFGHKCNLAHITHCPGYLHFFRFNITQQLIHLFDWWRTKTPVYAAVSSISSSLFLRKRINEWN